MGLKSWTGQSWRVLKNFRRCQEHSRSKLCKGFSRRTPLSLPIIIYVSPERAERHDAQEILRIARDLVHKVQILIDNK